MILKSISVILFVLVVGSLARDLTRGGSCFHSDSNSYLKPGEFLNLAGRKCGRITCQTDKTLSMEGCGVSRSYNPDCLKYDFDYSQNYPECCQMICMEYRDPSFQRIDRFSEPTRDLNEFGYQYSERDRYKRGGYSGGGYGGSNRDRDTQGIGSSSWNQGSGSNRDRDIHGTGSNSWNQGSDSHRDRDHGIGSSSWNQGSSNSNSGRPGSSGGHNHGLDSHSSSSPSGWGNQGPGSGGIHIQGSNFPIRPNQGNDRFPNNRPGSSTSHGIGGSSGGIHNQGIGGSSGSHRPGSGGSSGIHRPEIGGSHRPGSGGFDNHGIGSSTHSQHSGHGSPEHGSSFRPGGSGFNQGGFQNNDKDHHGQGHLGNPGRDDKVHYSGDFGRTYGNQDHGQNSHGSNSYGSGGYKKTGY